MPTRLFIGAAKDYFRPTLAAAGAALLVGFGPELWRAVFEKRPPISYAVAVYSSSLGNAKIAAANVALSIPGLDTISGQTSPDGIVIFQLEPSMAARTAQLKIEREGYGPIAGRTIRIPRYSAQESLYVDPQDTVAQLHLRADLEKLQVERAALGASSPVDYSLPKLKLEASTPQIRQVYTSGPKESGLLNKWSEWYELCSDIAPKGLSLATTQFELRGDRSCGAWAECRSTRQTPSQGCWEFRLQGHEEWKPARPSYSEGVLRVVWSAPR